MSQQVRARKQVNVSYVANNKETEQLSRGMIYRELYLRLTGQPTITAANNTVAKTNRGDEWGVIQRIDLIANNTDVLRSIKGSDLWWLNLGWYGKPPRVTPTLGDATTADPSFDSVLILPLWMPRSIRPIDTALDSRNLSDLKIEVTWGDHADISDDASGFTTAPVLEVYSLESFGVAGPFSQWRVYAIEKEVSATNPRFQIQLPVGHMYRGFVLNTTNDGADAADILNGFKIISGTTVYADLEAEVLEQVYGLRNNVSRSFSGSAYDDHRVSGASIIDGWFWYDHVSDGFNSEAIDTLGFSEFQLELDVTKASGTTKVVIYPQELIPVRGQARQAA